MFPGAVFFCVSELDGAEVVLDLDSSLGAFFGPAVVVTETYDYKGQRECKKSTVEIWETRKFQ